MKLSNIRLLVNDFDKCFAFYSDTLGLECSWGKPGDNYASFNIGLPSGLALFKANLMSQAINKAGAAENTVVNDKAVIIFEVENVDAVFINLESKAVNFLTAPKDMQDWGIRVVHLRDPENNLIELFTALPVQN
ncbi:VOC family protein [Pedobacter westerhofensis]|nr:VOC family protein [Pedobacter westerhofensis]